MLYFSTWFMLLLAVFLRVKCSDCMFVCHDPLGTCNYVFAMHRQCSYPVMCTSLTSIDTVCMLIVLMSLLLCFASKVVLFHQELLQYVWLFIECWGSQAVLRCSQ